MSNLSKNKYHAEQAAFVDECASLLVPRGMPRSIARLFSYLMLCPEPVSLDAICEDLQVAKSTASVAARLLEAAKLVRCQSQPGSKRVLYSLPDSPVGMMEDQHLSLGQLGQLIARAAGEVAVGDAAHRMREIAHFYQYMQRSLEQAVKDYPGM